MAAQQGGGSILAKVAARAKAAVLGVADKAPESGPIDIPPGLKNAVCQVTDCGFFATKPESKAKKADGSSAVGEPYWQATAVIVEPEYHEYAGRKYKVKGLQTRLYVPVYDTKDNDGKVTTLEEHLTSARKNVTNELKKLGATPQMIKAAGGDLEKVAAMVKKLAPYFNFSTSERKNQQTGVVDGAWENWNGREGLEGYKPGAPSKAEVLDETAHDPAAKTESRKVADAVTGANGKAAKAEPTPEPTAEYRDDTDIDSLLERTRGDGPDAQEACDALRSMAKAAGKTDDDVDNADSWDQVVGWINGGGDGDDEAPAVEDVFLFTIGGKQVEVEVLTVDEEAKTVTLKDLDKKKPVNDPKTKRVMNVPWAELTKRA